MYVGNFILAFVFLFSSAIMAGMTTALLQMGRLRAKVEFKKYPSLFFFQHFLGPLFGKRKWEGLFFTLSFSKHVLHLCYGVIMLFLLLIQDPFVNAIKILESHKYSVDTLWVLLIGAIIVTLSLIADMLMKFLATAAPQFALKFFAPFASVFLTIFAPLTSIFLRMLETFFPPADKDSKATLTISDKILEVLYESELTPHLDPIERKLILSVASFKERNAREVMVPRIDILSLSEETPVREAAETFLKEGYSRIPVYQENVDHIVGVLLYKDVLAAYARHPERANDPVKHLIKPVLYSPETKKIPQLLQEFRSKQIHLAIVVDEYGGTEGIVTIEDILEELVGEISDEYDVGQETLFSVLPSGGWIVDARMSILDIEKELGIKIPQSPEYDTIGGYIFHRAGSIPSRGWRLHHDDFDLEILSSDDRSIEKIKITPHEAGNE
jgi:CBS domain containing-hemolysin-like protein